MSLPELSQERRAANTSYARAARHYGPHDERTLAARREFGAARLAEAIEVARRYGVTDEDVIALVTAGRLPEAAAA